MMSNDEVMQKFDDDVLLRDLRPRTVDTYRRSFSMLLEFSGETEYAALTEEHLRNWLLHLKRETKLSGATINQYNSSCKFFLKVVLEQEINDSQVPNSKIRRKPQPFMSVDEVIQFFSGFDDIVSFTYFLLLYSTGLRRSETLSITMEDIHGDNNKPNEDYIFIRNGKGGKQRNVSLPHITYLMLREYYRVFWGPVVRNMTEEEKAGIKTMPLFPAKINGKKANTFFTKAFNSVRDGNILFKKFHPHTLRHSYAVHTLQKDNNKILKVKAQLGHSNLSSTEIYIGDANFYNVTNPMDPEEVAEILCRAFHERTSR